MEILNKSIAQFSLSCPHLNIQVWGGDKKNLEALEEWEVCKAYVYVSINFSKEEDSSKDR